MTRERKIAIADMALQLAEDYDEVYTDVSLSGDNDCSVMISRYPDNGYKSVVIFTPGREDGWYHHMEYRNDPNFDKCEKYIEEIAEEMETRDNDFAYWMEED